MAGIYSRFRLFGSKIPKYLFPLGNGTILSKILYEINISNKDNNLYFIANRNDQLFYPILNSILQSNKIPLDQLLYIDDTSSQLETAMYASELIKKNDVNAPVCFTNIDTIMKNRKLFFTTVKSINSKNAILDTFPGNSSQYSYVHANENGIVTEVVDKNKISKSACSGLYGFGSFNEMKSLSEDLLISNSKANFTDLFNCYLKKGRRVKHILRQDRRDTIVLGTPEEYITNIHKFEQ